MNGVTTWVKPKYTRVVTHTLPSGEKVTVKAGTQIIDRFWSHLRWALGRHVTDMHKWLLFSLY